MAPQKKIKTHKDSLKRPCFQCCVTKLYCNRAYLFEDRVFATPLVAYYYFNTIAKMKEEERAALLTRLISDTNLRIKGDFDDELCIEELLISNERDEETSIKASYDRECLISAEDFEKLQEETMEEDTFEDEKPAKIKSYVYVLEEDTVTELTQHVGQSLDQFLPPKLFYYGEKTLVHKNRDISVTVYVEVAGEDNGDGYYNYKNELFSKYFGDTQTLYGKVYVHSFSHLPMMESANAALDKEMEKMEVEEEVKERKKKARVPRKKVAKAIEQLHASEPGSAEEKEAVQELQEVAQAKKKKRAPKRKISVETINAELPFAEEEGELVKTPSPKKAKAPKKTEEEKAAEKQAKEEAKAAKLAEREAAKKAKEEEKAKKAAEREQKKKEKEDKKSKKQE
jgi:hypothetical protein